METLFTIGIVLIATLGVGISFYRKAKSGRCTGCSGCSLTGCDSYRKLKQFRKE